MQKQFTNFRASVDSFPLGEQQVGLNKPGRYNGYDTITNPGGGMSIRIGHSGRIRKTDKLGDDVNAFGAIIMPTGVIIHEGDDLNFIISINTSTTKTRKDLVICEHNYQEIQGGVPATYSIIEGGSTGTTPSLTDPTKQVIVGIISVDPSGNTYADINYTVNVTPLPGDMEAADLYSFISNLVAQEIAQEISDSGGEENTASNVGTGVGLFFQKNGEDLEFKSITSSYQSLTITPSANNKTLDLKVDPTLFTDECITVSGNLTLTNAHNGKLLRFTNTTLKTITIPTGLIAGFNVGFFQDYDTLPSTNGTHPFLSPVTPTLHIDTSAIKARAIIPGGGSGSGVMALIGQGYMGYIQVHPTVQNYCVLMGDLIEA